MAESSQKRDINDERAVRLAKVRELQEAGIAAYPATTARRESVRDALGASIGADIVIGGRVMTKREMGKLVFCHVEDESGRMQIVLKEDETGKDAVKQFAKYIDAGDIVEVHGERFETKKGEPSVLVREWRLLSKALRPLPDKFHGLQDEELRLRKRYLDILFNRETRDIFYKKAKFWSSMRAFLLSEGFLEVETPVLETTAGGADATPFVTHHNALDMDVYLRISMGELWQKRLMVGGFEKTFEIGRQFRNEGTSREHLQDYTQMECYWAYADYEKGMELVERMYKHIIQETFGTLVFDIGTFKNIDFDGEWTRIDFAQEVQRQTGVDIHTAGMDDLAKKLKELGVSYEAHGNIGRLIDALWKYCRKHIKGPVFLLHHPVDVSPLAKRHRTLHNATERYQIIIAGSELGNGYSELNDPVDQAERFAAQARLREAGDTEAQMHDADFVEALEHGMPPTTGFGLSERLFSYLLDKPIRECVLFPLMKPEGHAARPSSSVASRDSDAAFEPLPMTRDEAWELVKKYNTEQNEFNHYLESEAVMRALARRLGKDEEYWGMLGLLHDLDWHMTKDNETEHTTVTPKLLRQAGFPEDFIAVIISHAYGTVCAGLENKERKRGIEHALAAAETVTGLVHAASLMREDKIASLTPASLKKKFKDKKFAAKVNRNVIQECEKLDISVDDFLALSIDAIKEIADQIGLHR